MWDLSKTHTIGNLTNFFKMAMQQGFCEFWSPKASCLGMAYWPFQLALRKRAARGDDSDSDCFCRERLLQHRVATGSNSLGFRTEKVGPETAA